MRLSGVGGALRARARRFGVVRFSGVGGALRAPLGPVVAPLASSLRTPFRPHPPRNFQAHSGTAFLGGGRSSLRDELIPTPSESAHRSALGRLAALAPRASAKCR